MIRARFKRDGRDVLLLGLDDENVRRLTAGQPIFVDGTKNLLAPVDVLIMHGRTLDDVLAELRAAGVEMPSGTTGAKERA